MGSIYGQIRGTAAVARRILGDPGLAPYFEGIDTARLQRAILARVQLLRAEVTEA